MYYRNKKRRNLRKAANQSRARENNRRSVSQKWTRSRLRCWRRLQIFQTINFRKYSDTYPQEEKDLFRCSSLLINWSSNLKSQILSILIQWHKQWQLISHNMPCYKSWGAKTIPKLCYDTLRLFHLSLFFKRRNKSHDNRCNSSFRLWKWVSKSNQHRVPMALRKMGTLIGLSQISIAVHSHSLVVEHLEASQPVRIWMEHRIKCSSNQYRFKIKLSTWRSSTLHYPWKVWTISQMRMQMLFLMAVLKPRKEGTWVKSMLAKPNTRSTPIKTTTSTTVKNHQALAIARSEKTSIPPQCPAAKRTKVKRKIEQSTVKSLDSPMAITCHERQVSQA